jgi:spore coat polysaccharide biosynthesis predicted glycosyltransferase SpsG
MSGFRDKNVLIRADGSHAIGLGHIFRMRTLANGLKAKGARVAFISLADHPSLELLKAAGITVLAFDGPDYHLVLRDTIDSIKPDLVIQDVLDTSHESMAELRSLTSAMIVNIDDTAAGLEAADMVINSMVFHWNRYGKEKVKALLFEGPRYAILQPGIGTLIRREKYIHEHATEILIAIGGTDTHFVTQRALLSLNAVKTALNVRINMGPGSRISTQLERAIGSSPHRITLDRSNPDLLGAMFDADLVVCGGGTMLYELAAMGVPSACIATEPHEVLNMKYWEDQGATVALGWEKDLDGYSVSRTLNTLIDHSS